LAGNDKKRNFIEYEGVSKVKELISLL